MLILVQHVSYIYHGLALPVPWYVYVYNLSIHTAGILQDREFHGHNPAPGSSRS